MDKQAWILAKLLTTFGSFVCALSKHKRGRQLGMDILDDKGVTRRTYRCPRCGATWTRKIKKEKAE